MDTYKRVEDAEAIHSGEIHTFIPVLWARPNEDSDLILESIDPPVDLDSYVWTKVSEDALQGERGKDTIYCISLNGERLYFEAIAELAHNRKAGK